MKKTQISWKVFYVHGLKLLILLKYPYYPKQSKDSKQSQITNLTLYLKVLEEEKFKPSLWNKEIILISAETNQRKLQKLLEGSKKEN